MPFDWVEPESSVRAVLSLVSYGLAQTVMASEKLSMQLLLSFPPARQGWQLLVVLSAHSHLSLVCMAF